MDDFVHLIDFGYEDGSFTLFEELIYNISGGPYSIPPGNVIYTDLLDGQPGKVGGWNSTNSTNTTLQLGGGGGILRGRRYIQVWPEQTMIALHALVVGIAVISNLVVVATILGVKRMRRPFNMFILSMAVGDIITVLLSLVFTFVPVFMENFVYGDIGCRLGRYMQGVSTSTTSWMMVCMAVDRWWAIMLPMSFHMRSKKSTTFFIVGTWTLSMIFNIPLIFIYHQRGFTPANGRHVCTEIWYYTKLPRLVKQAYNVLFNLLLKMWAPLVITVALNTVVGLTLWGITKKCIREDRCYTSSKRSWTQSTNSSTDRSTGRLSEDEYSVDSQLGANCKKLAKSVNAARRSSWAAERLKGWLEHHARGARMRWADSRFGSMTSASTDTLDVMESLDSEPSTFLTSQKSDLEGDGADYTRINEGLSNSASVCTGSVGKGDKLDSSAEVLSEQMLSQNKRRGSWSIRVKGWVAQHARNARDSWSTRRSSSRTTMTADTDERGGGVINFGMEPEPQIGSTCTPSLVDNNNSQQGYEGTIRGETEDNSTESGQSRAPQAHRFTDIMSRSVEEVSHSDHLGSLQRFQGGQRSQRRSDLKSVTKSGLKLVTNATGHDTRGVLSAVAVIAPASSSAEDVLNTERQVGNCSSDDRAVNGKLVDTLQMCDEISTTRRSTDGTDEQKIAERWPKAQAENSRLFDGCQNSYATAPIPTEEKNHGLHGAPSLPQDQTLDMAATSVNTSRDGVGSMLRKNSLSEYISTTEPYNVNTAGENVSVYPCLGDTPSEEQLIKVPKKKRSVTFQESDLTTLKTESSYVKSSSYTPPLLRHRRQPEICDKGARSNHMTQSMSHTIYPKSTAERQVRQIRTLAAVVGLYFLCWMPINTLFFWKEYNARQLLDFLQENTTVTMACCRLLSYTSACANAIIYSFLYESFREAFFELVCGPKKKKTPKWHDGKTAGFNQRQ